MIRAMQLIDTCIRRARANGTKQFIHLFGPAPRRPRHHPSSLTAIYFFVSIFLPAGSKQARHPIRHGTLSAISRSFLSSVIQSIVVTRP